MSVGLFCQRQAFWICYLRLLVETFAVTESPPTAAAAATPKLAREVGVFGATMMGLGSIIGTGVFVSIGIAAESAGPAVVLAIALAAGVAICNGLSSAALAANHPVSGGTYEYGYRWLHPLAGFAAGWLFLCAKCASAATAALGCVGYGLHLAGIESTRLATLLAVLVVIVLTILVLGGIRRSNTANIVIVSVTLAALVLFILAGLPGLAALGGLSVETFFVSQTRTSPVFGFLEATALMFVAYTGYGRIATLGEEIRDPRRNIPRAIVATLALSMTLYILAGLVLVAARETGGAALDDFARRAPLEAAARQSGRPGLPLLVAIGAMTAMLGVLLNLILGLSRVVLAMGRRNDLPVLFARVDASGQTPYVAVIAVGLVIALFAAIGNVKTTWSMSAFTVLSYYAITNLAATRLTPAEQLYPRVIPWIGLGSCLFLAVWVEPVIWLYGLGLLLVGFVVRGIVSAFAAPRR